MSGAIVVGDPGEALAAGTTTDASTTGGSTGASSGGESSAAETSATGSNADGPTPGNLVLVALGTGAGVIAGAAAVWLALRRRSMPKGSLARAE